MPPDLPMNDTKAEKINRIVAVVLRIPPGELVESAALGQTPHWDSLAQLDILAALEQEFGLIIEPDQAIDLVSLKALIDYVEKNS